MTAQATARPKPRVCALTRAMARASEQTRSMAFEHGDGAEAALEVVLEGPRGQHADLVGGRRLRRGEGLVEAAAEDVAQQGQRRRADRRARPAGTAEHAAFG